VKAAVDRIIEKSHRLNEIYEDASGYASFVVGPILH